MIPKYMFESVTSAVSLLISGQEQGDGIVVHIVNDSSTKEQARVIIYQNTGAGAQVVVDQGDTEIVPSWSWGLGYTIKNSGEYWVRIQATSEFLISQVSFERIIGGIWTPIVMYKPGDFAVFELTPKRKRIW